MAWGSIQFIYFFVNPHERRIRIRAFSQQDDPFDYVVVVENLAVHLVNGFAVSAEPDFRPLRDDGDVLHPDGSAAFGGNNGLLNIVNGFHQTYRADVDLLQSGLDKTAPGVD